MPHLTEAEIAERVKLGRKFCRRFVLNDRQASSKFRDASLVPNLWSSGTGDDDDWNEEEGGDVPTDAPIGVSNALTTNIVTKCASIAIGNPDWYAGTSNPENAPIVRTFLREKWRLYNWVRLSQKVLQKRYVSGLGVLAYRWDDKTRSTFEFVQTWDLAIDPHTTDFSTMKWAARRIKMPLREAIAEYGTEPFSVANLADDGYLDRERVDIWLYYDQDTEAHVYEGKVLNKDNDNQYGRVPFLWLEGDIDPGTSIWPLGDSQMAAGLQAELSDLNQIISRSAKHGGSINLIDAERLGKAGQEALEDGVPNGFIPVKDLLSPPIVRIPGEALSDTLLEAKREAQQAMDGVQGVNQYMRGVISQSAKFATEAAYVSQQSGARGIQSRVEFERFLNRMAETIIMLEVAFGGPREGHTTDEEYILWEALQDVTEIYVIENSTAFKDPAMEAQTKLQVLNTVAQLTLLFAQTGQPVPNLQHYLDDYLRASGIQDTSRYWLAPTPQMPQPGAPQQSAPPM